MKKYFFLFPLLLSLLSCKRPLSSNIDILLKELPVYKIDYKFHQVNKHRWVFVEDRLFYEEKGNPVEILDYSKIPDNILKIKLPQKNTLILPFFGRPLYIFSTKKDNWIAIFDKYAVISKGNSAERIIEYKINYDPPNTFFDFSTISHLYISDYSELKNVYIDYSNIQKADQQLKSTINSSILTMLDKHNFTPVQKKEAADIIMSFKTEVKLTDEYSMNAEKIYKRTFEILCKDLKGELLGHVTVHSKGSSPNIYRLVPGMTLAANEIFMSTTPYREFKVNGILVKSFYFQSMLYE